MILGQFVCIYGHHLNRSIVKTMSSERETRVEYNEAKKHRACPMAESSSSSSSSSGSPPVTTIPQDHLFSILLLLPVESILCFAMTCNKFKSLAYSDSFWESVCRRDWGDSLSASDWKKLYQQLYQLDSVSCRPLSPDAYDNRPRPRASHSVNLVSGCLLLFGGGCEGGRHLDDTWVAYMDNDLRRTTLKWQKVGSGIPSGRFGHSCVVIGERLILFGGINDLGFRHNDAWIGQVTAEENNSVTMSWRLLDVGTVAPPPRGAHAGCCIDNRRMLVHGGIGLSGRRLGDTWILEFSEDFRCGTWTKIITQPCPSSRSGHTLTHMGGAQTILFGGRGTVHEVLSDVWLLDAFEGGFRWAELSFELCSVPQGLSLPRVGHSANLIIGGRLLIYGGEDSNRHRKDDFWVLDISSVPHVGMQRPMNLKQNRAFRKMWNKIEPKGEKPECRSFHGACVDESGRFLYIYGGMIDGLIQPADPSGLRFDGGCFLVDLLVQA